jgi:hypothetical protein
MPNVPIPDLDLIHSWRQHGVSFREIGWRLAMKHGRTIAFTGPSVQTAYAMEARAGHQDRSGKGRSAVSGKP